MIKENWTPFGGISFSVVHNVWYCAQVMTTKNMAPNKWDNYTGE